MLIPLLIAWLWYLRAALYSRERGRCYDTGTALLAEQMYGKEFEGIERSTFLIDAKGLLRQEWRKVRVPGHVEAVLEATKAL